MQLSCCTCGSMWSLCRPLVSGPANTRHSPIIPGWRACACPGCVPGFVQAIGLPSALVGRYDWLLGLVVAVGVWWWKYLLLRLIASRSRQAAACLLLPAAGGPPSGGQPTWTYGWNVASGCPVHAQGAAAVSACACAGAYLMCTASFLSIC